jgi:hypothetical protein
VHEGREGYEGGADNAENLHRTKRTETDRNESGGETPNLHHQGKTVFGYTGVSEIILRPATRARVAGNQPQQPTVIL